LYDLLNGSKDSSKNSRLVFSYIEKFINIIPEVNIIIFFSVIEFLLKNNDMDNELSISILKALVDKVSKVKVNYNLKAYKCIKTGTR